MGALQVLTGDTRSHLTSVGKTRGPGTSEEPPETESGQAACEAVSGTDTQEGVILGLRGERTC